MKKSGWILLTLCLLNLIYCCSTTKQISTANAEYYAKDLNFLILHTPVKIFELHDYKIKHLTLEGRLKAKEKDQKKAIHVYVKNEPEINPSDCVVIQWESVQKITYDTKEVPMEVFWFIEELLDAVFL